MTTSKKFITVTETEEENGLYDITEEIEVPLNLKPGVFIFHYPDCSGYAAGAIILNSITDSKKNYRLIPFRPAEVLDLGMFNASDEVYVTDCLFSEETLEVIRNKVSALTLLDYYDTTKSSAMLAWEKFVPEYPPSEVVTLLDIYHCNFVSPKKNPEYNWHDVVIFNLACASMLNDFSFWTCLLNGYFIDNKLLTLGKEMYKKFLDSIEEIKESAVTEIKVIEGNRVAFIFAYSNKRLIMDTILKDKKLNLDAVFCSFKNEKDKWTTKLRFINPSVSFCNEASKNSWPEFSNTVEKFDGDQSDFNDFLIKTTEEFGVFIK